MIISRTPYRVSLFGEGTDFPAWSNQHGGAVLGFTINRYNYISLRVLPPFFDYVYRVVWSQVELVQKVADIRHPVVRTVLQRIPKLPGLEIHHDGDLPAGAGMGAGSSFTVGMLNTFHAFQGRLVTPDGLAREAIHLEHDILNEKVGRQDQILASHGGFQHLQFFRDGSFQVNPVVISQERRERLQSSLMMFFTGHCRNDQAIVAEIQANLSHLESLMTTLGALPQQALAILQNEHHPLRDLGLLLHEAWQLKCQLATGIASPQVTAIYQAAREAGAVGGKLTGVGGGGILLLFVEPEHQAKVRQRLAHLVEIPCEIGSSGSKIVVYEPDDFLEPFCE